MKRRQLEGKIGNDYVKTEMGLVKKPKERGNIKEKERKEEYVKQGKENYLTKKRTEKGRIKENERKEELIKQGSEKGLTKKR